MSAVGDSLSQMRSSHRKRERVNMRALEPHILPARRHDGASARRLDGASFWHHFAVAKVRHVSDGASVALTSVRSPVSRILLLHENTLITKNTLIISISFITAITYNPMDRTAQWLLRLCDTQLAKQRTNIEAVNRGRTVFKDMQDRSKILALMKWEESHLLELRDEILDPKEKPFNPKKEWIRSSAQQDGHPLMILKPPTNDEAQAISMAVAQCLEDLTASVLNM